MPIHEPRSRSAEKPMQQSSEIVAASHHNEIECQFFTVLPLEVRELIYTHLVEIQPVWWWTTNRSGKLVKMTPGRISGLIAGSRIVCRKLKSEYENHDMLNTPNVLLFTNAGFFHREQNRFEDLNCLLPKFFHAEALEKVELSFEWQSMSRIGEVFQAYAAIALGQFPTLRLFRACFYEDISTHSGADLYTAALSIANPRRLALESESAALRERANTMVLEAQLIGEGFSSQVYPPSTPAPEEGRPWVEDRDVCEWIVTIPPDGTPAGYTWDGVVLNTRKSYKSQRTYTKDEMGQSCTTVDGPATWY